MKQSDTDTLKTRPSAVVGVAAGGGTTLSVESGNDSSVGATSGGNSALVKESVVQPTRQQLEVSKYYNFKYIFRVALVLIVLIQIETATLMLSCFNDSCWHEGTFECHVVRVEDFCFCKLGYHGVGCQYSANHAFFKSALRKLSGHSRVLDDLEDDAIVHHMVMMSLFSPHDISENIRGVMRNKRYHIESVGDHLAVTQHASVGQLFRMGVRYFHAHLELYEGGVYVTNSLLGDRFAVVVRQLELVMLENPDEVVVLHVERTLFDIEDEAFDNMVAALFNATYTNSKRDDLTEIRFGDIQSSRCRLVVVYPRRTDAFWAEEDSMLYSGAFSLSESHAETPVDENPDEELMHVIKSATPTEFTEFTGHMIASDDIAKSNTLMYLMRVLHGSMEPRQHAAYIRGNPKLTNKVFSMNNVSLNACKEMVRKNGKYFIV